MVYIFIRNKKKGLKKIVREVETVEEARNICIQENCKNQPIWYEYTEDIEYTKNGSY